MKIVETITVDVATLGLKSGWRKDLDESTVEALVATMRGGQQVPPIRITPDRRVVYGHHRIAAAMAAEMKALRAEVVEFASAAEEEAAVIGENLCRRQVAGPDRAMLTARLKVLYERQHPDATPGAVRAAAGNRSQRKRVLGSHVGAPGAPTFTKHLATQTGRSERAIQEDAQLGEALDGEQLAAMADAGVPRKEQIRIAIMPASARPKAVLSAVAAASRPAVRPSAVRAPVEPAPRATEPSAGRVRDGLLEVQRSLESAIEIVAGLEAEGAGSLGDIRERLAALAADVRARRHGRSVA